MKKYSIEAIGTFFLVLAAAAGGGYAAAAALCAMIYLGGHISGAHYNPAVSLAILIRGKMPAKDLIPYIIFQAVGAIAAAFLYKYLAGSAPETTAAVTDTTKGMIVEFLATFALAFTVLNVATAKGTEGNNYFGIAIALCVVFGGAIAALGGTIGALNPAVALGLTLTGHSAMSSLWLYLVACSLGGAAAGIKFKMLNPDNI